MIIILSPDAAISTINQSTKMLVNTLITIPVFYRVLPIRNRRKPQDPLHMIPKLHSEVRIRAEPTWCMLIYSE